MKITRVTRFEDVINDEDGSIIESYHGYDLLIDDEIGARIYDHESTVFIALDASREPDSVQCAQLLQLMLGLGYDDVRFLSASNGYKTLEEIWREAYLPRDCWGKPKRLGRPCPQCGMRLFRGETQQCDCGWRKG
jgi:hypothetical protein